MGVWPFFRAFFWGLSSESDKRRLEAVSWLGLDQGSSLKLTGGVCGLDGNVCNRVGARPERVFLISIIRPKSFYPEVIMFLWLNIVTRRTVPTRTDSAETLGIELWSDKSDRMPWYQVLERKRSLKYLRTRQWDFKTIQRTAEKI